MLINHKSSYAFEQFRSEDFKTCELSYQAPEVIERIIDKETADKMKSKIPINGIDVWSVGIVLLEIVVGFPVWIR